MRWSILAFADRPVAPLSPVPPSLEVIEHEPLDILTKREKLGAEASRLGVRPVFNRDPFSRDYGKLLGVR
jgi:hypothetical protein